MVRSDDEEEDEDTLPVRKPLPVLPPRKLSVPPAGENNKCCICWKGFLNVEYFGLMWVILGYIVLLWVIVA